jgi:pyrroline-5-carboxylate reductase
VRDSEELLRGAPRAHTGVELPRAIGTIGAGQMAEAILRGLIAGGHPPAELFASDPLPERRAHLQSALGIRVTQDNAELADRVDLAVLAVKPSQLETAAQGLGTRPLYVSILAGRTLADLRRVLGPKARVVRAMPNTPALIGQAASALAAPPGLAEEEVALAEALLRKVGDVVRVPEGLLDAVTALSGSGPAYAYVFLEALTEAGVGEGLDAATARRLATRTLLGAAALALHTGEHPALLRERVSSPAGTTVAGLAALEAGGFRPAIMAAVRAAADRARALARQGSGKSSADAGEPMKS